MRHPLLAAYLLPLALMLSAGAMAEDRGGLKFFAVLSGAQEVPAVDTAAGARALALFDRAFTRVTVIVHPDSELNIVAAHFHCARAGANGPVAFGLLNPGPLTMLSGRTRVVLDNDDFVGTDCTEAVGRPVNNIAALALAMRDELIYLNLHTPFAPAGEVRGQMLELGR